MTKIDPNKMMAQLGQMQAQMEKAQEELKTAYVEHSAGGAFNRRCCARQHERARALGRAPSNGRRRRRCRADIPPLQEPG